MNRLKIILTCICLTMFTTSSAYAGSELAVIVNSNAGIATASSENIARLFLGKSKELDGVRLTPIDQPKDAAVTEKFSVDVIHKKPSQLRAYWSKLLFTGKGTPPKEYGSNAAVVSAVAGDPTLIGYVDAASVDGSVKVLLTIQ